MNIVLFGATGTNGRRILSGELARGHLVTALMRYPARLHRRSRALRVVRGDVLSATWPESVVEREDIVVSAVGGGLRHRATAEPAARSLVAGLRTTAAQWPNTRLITVGGAGSLRMPDGTQLWDIDDVPDTIRHIKHAAGLPSHYRLGATGLATDGAGEEGRGRGGKCC